jgi:hypothetical protein
VSAQCQKPPRLSFRGRMREVRPRAALNPSGFLSLFRRANFCSVWHEAGAGLPADGRESSH